MDVHEFVEVNLALRQLEMHYSQRASELGLPYAMDVEGIIQRNDMNCIWTALAIAGLEPVEEFIYSDFARPYFQAMVRTELPVFGGIVAFEYEMNGNKIFKHSAVITGIADDFPTKVIQRKGFNCEIKADGIAETLAKYRNGIARFYDPLANYQALLDLNDRLRRIASDGISEKSLGKLISSAGFTEYEARKRIAHTLYPPTG